MNTDVHNSGASMNGAHAALLNLCSPFAPAGEIPQCEVVQPDSIAGPAHALLVHSNHMTLELGRHYGQPVEVRVLQEHRQDMFYTRKVALELAGTSRVVEWGIAKVNFEYLSPAIRTEILAKQTPLGLILVRHNMRRRISPRYFVRFGAAGGVGELFGAGRIERPVYGRLSTVYCDEQPTIDLLEIVVNIEAEHTS